MPLLVKSLGKGLGESLCGLESLESLGASVGEKPGERPG